MKKYFLTTVIALIALSFVSCEKNEADNQAPVIHLVAPEEDEPVKPGSGIYLEAVFSDNVALGKYKVNIHGSFDGHSHGHAAVRAAEDSVAFEKTWLDDEFVVAGEEPIAGKRSVTVHHRKIVIPTEINGKPIKEGHYHFMIHCTDRAGNESLAAREIVISSTT